MKLKAKYEKGQLPAGLAEFAVERDGFMFLEFEDDVALLTNPALAAKNVEILDEKRKLQTNYDNLVTSSGDLARQVNELRTQIASGGQVSANELAIVTALKGIDTTPDEIKKMIKEYPTLAGELQSLKSQAENEKIAKILKWKPEIFNDIRNHPDRKDLEFKVESIVENGKSTDKVYVLSKDATGAVVKKEVSDFVKESPTWTGYLSALQAGEELGQTWLEQAPAGGSPAGGKSPLDEHIEKMNAAAISRGNALVKPPTPAQQPTA